MNFRKKVKRAAAKIIPSPITVSFEEGGGHFIQEDIGVIMADRTHQFIQKNPI